MHEGANTKPKYVEGEYFKVGVGPEALEKLVGVLKKYDKKGSTGEFILPSKPGGICFFAEVSLNGKKQGNPKHEPTDDLEKWLYGISVEPGDSVIKAHHRLLRELIPLGQKESIDAEMNEVYEAQQAYLDGMLQGNNLQS